MATHTRRENERILLLRLCPQFYARAIHFRHDYSPYRRRLLSRDFPYCLKNQAASRGAAVIAAAEAIQPC